MRVTIDIPDDVHADLKKRAKLEGTTMRALILRSIQEFLRDNKASVLSADARPNAK